MDRPGTSPTGTTGNQIERASAEPITSVYLFVWSHSMWDYILSALLCSGVYSWVKTQRPPENGETQIWYLTILTNLKSKVGRGVRMEPLEVWLFLQNNRPTMSNLDFGLDTHFKHNRFKTENKRSHTSLKVIFKCPYMDRYFGRHIL